MKYHLTIDDKKAVCGSVTNRPDTFLYNEKGFTSHLAKEYQCKKCLKIYKQTLKTNNNG